MSFSLSQALFSSPLTLVKGKIKCYSPEKTVGTSFKVGKRNGDIDTLVTWVLTCHLWRLRSKLYMFALPLVPCWMADSAVCVQEKMLQYLLPRIPQIIGLFKSRNTLWLVIDVGYVQISYFVKVHLEVRARSCWCSPANHERVQPE